MDVIYISKQHANDNKRLRCCPEYNKKIKAKKSLYLITFFACIEIDHVIINLYKIEQWFHIFIKLDMLLIKKREKNRFLSYR